MRLKLQFWVFYQCKSKENIRLGAVGDWSVIFTHLICNSLFPLFIWTLCFKCLVFNPSFTLFSLLSRSLPLCQHLPDTAAINQLQFIIFTKVYETSLIWKIFDWISIWVLKLSVLVIYWSKIGWVFFCNFGVKIFKNIKFS